MQYLSHLLEQGDSANLLIALRQIAQAFRPNLPGSI